MPLYTGLDNAPRRYRGMDGKPPKPRSSAMPASDTESHTTSKPVVSDSNVAVPQGDQSIDLAPQIPHREVRRNISQKKQAPSEHFFDRDMLPSQRRQRGDMGFSYYDQLVQEPGDRSWFRTMENIDARRVQQTSSSPGFSGNTTTTKDFAIAPARKADSECSSPLSRQSVPSEAPAQQTEPQNASSSSKTFHDILRGMEKVLTALKK